ncbi:hypothetical protein DH2020_014805 [Rehmannia glutinosa]|uniref:Uncharacterized protein n=1 Tax=Rehmannia glutinosa TaxID=99300 RepID=A0ABR0X159_REHGL
MKSAQAWRLGMKDMQILPAPRQRGQLKKPTWIIVLVSLVSLFLVCAYVYPPQNSAACYVFSANGCKALQNWLPPAPARELTDDEIASRVVIRDILNMPPTMSASPKIAFLFLTPGALPFEKLWDKFFQLDLCVLFGESMPQVFTSDLLVKAIFPGSEVMLAMKVDSLCMCMHPRINLYILAVILSIEIRGGKVVWGKISMVDAERRLLGNALKDPENQHFVLLSDSCIPLPLRILARMEVADTLNICYPVEKKDFRKGAQWFTMKRQHALIVMADSLYYNKFRDYCRMLDPAGIANWSVTHVDWSEGKWHPKSYRAQDITFELMKNITVWLGSF